MRATHSKATDGRILISVLFERQSPEADTPTIEVIYALRFPEDVTLAAETRVLVHLSSTQVDTRQAIRLTSEEDSMVLESASDHAAAMTREW